MSTYLIESATKVKLRGRINKSKEFVSLYLDYMDNKVRKYEFLPDRIYYKPINKMQKDYNDAIMRSAQQALGLKNLTLLNDTTQLSKHLSQVYFEDFFKYAKNHTKPDGDDKEFNTKVFYDSSLNKIKEYRDISKVRMKDIDNKWVWGYREFLLQSGLAKSTSAIYLQNIDGIFKLALKKGYVDRNPCLGVDPIRKPEPEVNYIFHEDLQKLKEAECIPTVKRPCLFASQTGMRAGDLKGLRWKDIGKADDMYRIVLLQEKTDKPYIIHFRKSVMEIIGKRGDPEDLVFPGFKNDNACNAEIALWFAKAQIQPRGNINKKFTPHDFRHTYAINLGLNGANLYEISQMIGHREVRTTEKYYARILEQMKRKIVNNLPDL
jgi:integrase